MGQNLRKSTHVKYMSVLLFCRLWGKLLQWRIIYFLLLSAMFHNSFLFSRNCFLYYIDHSTRTTHRPWKAFIINWNLKWKHISDFSSIVTFFFMEIMQFIRTLKNVLTFPAKALQHLLHNNHFCKILTQSLKA